MNDDSDPLAKPIGGPRYPPESLALLGRCVSFTNDTIVITEAQPLGEPGPRIVFVNQGFERQTGYRPEEVIGRTPRMLQGPKTDRKELRRIRNALERWEQVRAEVVNYAKDGREFTVEMDIVPVADHTGSYTHWVSVQRDVTARKRAEREARARETQREASLGALAAGIAHDFNNIVGAILGNVALAREDALAGRSPLPSLDQIQTASLRARRLVQQILAYGRRRPEAFVREPLGQIIAESAALLRSTLPAGIEIEVSIPPEPLDVLADASQLNQVLLNLGTNAWHAIDVAGREGRVTVDCRAVTPGTDGKIDGFDHFQPAPSGRHALIRFSDDGCGMDAATLERIFEPYFTTKAIGRGTGLGLSASAGILAAHGASIRVESEPGRGTTFELLFPLLPQSGAPAPIAPPRPAPPGKGRGERVLVVDDDEVVLLMLETLLRRAGYEVTAFVDSPAALAAARARPGDFDIVVTDHNMPALSGLQLAREIVVAAPALPVVLASGFLDDKLRAAASEAGAAAVIGKEFTAESLSELLQSVLHGRTD